MNLANIITLGRVFVIPFFMYFLYNEMLVPALVIFIIASISDFLDGYIARKYNMVTNFGKFMDPTADKLLVFSALLLFIEIDLMSSVLVVIIIAREFMVLTMRIIAIEKNIVVPAMWSGKVKTTVQMLAIILMMTPFANIVIADFITINDILAYTMTLITLYSGIDYFAKSKDVFKDN